MGASSDNLLIIADLYRRGLLSEGARIADIGCQQLRGATADNMRDFFAPFRNTPADFERFAEHNRFISEHLTATGFFYRSFDIVEAPMCEYFDLNTASVPRRWRGTFDLVLNFGTSEHVMNQYNAFKTMHDLARPGGLIYSFFIRSGNMEHGLLHYSDQFLDLLCRTNEYETIWREDQSGCTWAIYRRGHSPFRAIVDVQLGEEFPQMKTPMGRIARYFR